MMGEELEIYVNLVNELIEEDSADPLELAAAWPSWCRATNRCCWMTPFRSGVQAPATPRWLRAFVSSTTVAVVTFGDRGDRPARRMPSLEPRPLKDNPDVEMERYRVDVGAHHGVEAGPDRRRHRQQKRTSRAASSATSTSPMTSPPSICPGHERRGAGRDQEGPCLPASAADHPLHRSAGRQQLLPVVRPAATVPSTGSGCGIAAPAVTVPSTKSGSAVKVVSAKNRKFGGNKRRDS